MGAYIKLFYKGTHFGKLFFFGLLFPIAVKYFSLEAPTILGLRQLNISAVFSAPVFPLPEPLMPVR